MWIVILALPLILVSCSGGGGTTDAPPSPPAVGPTPAKVIWQQHTFTEAAGNRYALLRSQTDGSKVLTLADEPTISGAFAPLAGGGVTGVPLTMLYQTQATQIGGPGPRDIWAVQVDGTNKHVLVHTADDNVLRDVIGLSVVYENITSALDLGGLKSVPLDGVLSQVLAVSPAFYERSVAGRAVFSKTDGNLYSVLPDGTDARQLTTLPRGPNGEFPFLGTRGAVGTQVIYSALSLPQLVPDLFAVPVTGGAVTVLANSPDYEYLGAVVGTRVVYHRCAVLSADRIGQCDLYSVQSDGSGTVALSTNPDNDMVQGVVGTRVIVRRNHPGVDTLYSINADGSGGESTILALSVQDDFVIGFVETRIILRRANGLWSVRADGTGLVRLTPSAEPDTFTAEAAGGFACFARGPSGQQDLWCVPADGSAPASPLATSEADESFVTSF